MRLLTLLLVFSVIAVNAQSVDYNLKKGYVAKGYDVVEYFNNTAIKGDKAFSTTYDGAKFKFASQENLERFLSNPKQYIPQYGGYCAYAVALKSKKVDIDPETFEIRDGKLYLFYNSWGTNTLELWQKEDVKNLQQNADKNWEAIKQ